MVKFVSCIVRPQQRLSIVANLGLFSPRGVVVNAIGDVLIADAGNNCVLMEASPVSLATQGCATSNTPADLRPLMLWPSMALISCCVQSITSVATNAKRPKNSMKAVLGTMLGLAIAMGGWACSAQQATIPFKQLERDAQLSARLTVPDNEIASSVSSSSPSSSSSSSSSVFPGVVSPELSAASYVRVPPVPVANPRTLSSSFYLLNGLHLGMAIFDVEMTQRCIATHHCREGNPLMPSSLAGSLTVNLALVGSGSYISYRLKKHRATLWWLSPTVGTASHTVGVATSIAHQ